MTLPYYKRFPRDFLEGTIGLSFEEKGAYAIVLDLIYMRGGQLEDDARYIAGQLGCSVRLWKSLLSSLVSKGKITVKNGFICNFRAEKELETLGKYQDKQSKNRSNPNKTKEIKSPKVDHSRDYSEPDIRIEKEEDKSSSKNSRPQIRGTRFNPDMALPPGWTAYASSKGLTLPETETEFEKFRNYWIAKSGKDATKTDWDATWRNWIIRSAERRGLVNPSGSNYAGGRDKPARGWAASLSQNRPDAAVNPYAGPTVIEAEFTAVRGDAAVRR